MNERFVVFDVETPNSANNRMSSIGITVVENRMITDSFCTLIDPEVHFDRFNIMLTGITPEAVEGKPAFDELWSTLQPIFDSGLLIAHNAPFDMGVLAKCIKSYRIDWHEDAQYACTCRMARKAFPHLPNHKLNTLCEYLGIELNHHDAASDSKACAQLLISCLDNGINPADFIRSYAFDKPGKAFC